jgi:predicted nucleic acid-binding protein
VTYFDTSALIKRFVHEKGSPVMRNLMSRPVPFASATIAYAEVYSGLTRRHREGSLPTPHYTSACAQFEHDWPAFLHVELQEEVLRLARDLIKRHALRSFDAIHLASALSLQVGLSEAITMVAADERLLQAAAAEQLGVLNVEAAKTPPRFPNR